MEKLRKLFILIVMISLILPTSAVMASGKAEADVSTVQFTILHTNDFHGNLEFNTPSDPGAARVADKINTIRTAKGAANVLLVDGGDEMQGTLLSNINKGVPTVAYYRTVGYDAVTFGNHEFDWGQTVLQARIDQAQAAAAGSEKPYSFLTSNIVLKGSAADCSSAGWDKPFGVEAYKVFTANGVKVAMIGVTTQEVPIITIASATNGLCFKDPSESIQHYYADMKANADVIVVLSHLGFEDGGYGYGGVTVYGDKTLAGKLNTAAKPVDLIIGGHSHTDSTAYTKVGNTYIAQAYKNGRVVGQFDVTYDTSTKAVTGATFTRNAVSVSGTEDATVKTLIDTFKADQAYKDIIGAPVGYTNVPITANYNGDSLMGYFVNDGVMGYLNTDANTTNDVDMVFNNAGGLRADITSASYPYLMTYGDLYKVLPFGNQTVVGTLTGAQVVELLNQSATLTKGALQPAGVRYKFYRYAKVLSADEAGEFATQAATPYTWAWGAYDIQVLNRTSGQYEAIDLTKTYKVATNDFLAPAGQDNFSTFKYMTNLTFWGDMIENVISYVKAQNPDAAHAYAGVLDGRITRDGDDSGGSIVPLTVLHHNDSHGNLMKTSYVGYTQLAAKIKIEKLYNPTRTILLSSGDNIQGDAMMYYYKSAPLGYSADGNMLPAELKTHPLIGAFNRIGYDAMVLGNHEFNYGNEIFKAVLRQATFPVLQANMTDDGRYGIADVPVKPYVETKRGDIKIAILGIGNHRIPNYELPSDILGLAFQNPVETAASLTPALRAKDDVVIALTHIGFTTDPKSVEIDNNVDTYLAQQVGGIDAIIGGHSHTDPTKGSDPYKYLPSMIKSPTNPVILNQAYRYNSYLGRVIIGLKAKAADGSASAGYDVVTRAGDNIKVNLTDAEDTDTKTFLTPYDTQFTTYKNQVIGTTTTPIDAVKAYTEETNGANQQADAAVWQLNQQNYQVDFHLSGAMANKAIAAAATPASPVNLTINDMFTLMPYENSLVVLRMNGPQIKAVLERAYRNYYYYKYVPGYGGYSYYTTCNLDTNFGNQLAYLEKPDPANPAVPLLPDGDNVLYMKYGSKYVDFNDAFTYYTVSTVNYLAAGSCNYNDNGVSLWPLDQMVASTKNFVRDSVINYVTAKGSDSPVIEGRMQFLTTLPAPIATSLNPDQVAPFTTKKPFILEVHGANFTATSKVIWTVNGVATELPTTYLSSSTLTAQISRKAIKAALGRAGSLATQITVQTAAGTTTPLTFTLVKKNGKPVLTSLSFTSVKVKSAAFDMVLTGENFAFDSYVLINGKKYVPVFVDENHLAVPFTAKMLAKVKTYSIKVVTPNGGSSKSLKFKVLK
jgi:2',3'-cyclic-nucleotide 2'-phosphodiesterase (5'-nucleotidase family)